VLHCPALHVKRCLNIYSSRMLSTHLTCVVSSSFNRTSASPGLVRQ